MADTKLSDLTSGTAAATDIIYAVKDPSGTPLDRKVALSSVKDLIVGSGSVSVASGKTLTASNTLTLAGTDATTMTFPSTSTTLAGLGIANSFTTAQTITPLTDAAALTVRRNSGSQSSNIFQVQTEANAALASFDKDGKLTAPKIDLYGATSGTVTVQPAATAGTYTLTLPTNDGDAGQFLKTDGSGVLSWGTVSASPGGSDTQLQYNSSGSFAGASGITTDGTDLSLGSSSTLKFSTDLILGRKAAANLRLGAADAASPVAQTISTQNVVAGTTNTAGTNLTIGGSQGTGTGVGGNINFQLAPAGSSGTAQNALTTVASLAPAGTGGALTLTGGTVTSSSPILNMTQTWNASGTTFSGLKLNVTDTASANASLLMDLQFGGTSIFGVRRYGVGASKLDRTVLSLTKYSYILNGNSGGFVGFGVDESSLNFSINIGSGGLSLSSGSPISWNNSGSNVAAGTNDLFLTRRAAANLRFGEADAAAPVAQTLSVQSVVAGTSNTAGANLTITGSQGTGTGAGGSIIFQVAPAGSTGTAQNALSTALTISGEKFATFTGGLAPGSVNPGINTLGTYGGHIFMSENATNWLFLNNPDFYISSTSTFGFGSTSSMGTAILDVALRRDAANTLALRNSTNAQRFNIYGTYTSATNYERLFAEYNGTATAFRIGTEKGSGGGTARNLEIQTDGTTRLIVDTNGMLDFAGTTSSFPALKRSSATLQVRLADDSAYTTVDAQLRSQGTAPATAASTGTAGDIRYDADYIYICTATDTWKRVAIATW